MINFFQKLFFVYRTRGPLFKGSWMQENMRREDGLAALLITMIVVFTAMVIALSSVFIFLNRVQAARNIGYSEQAYFAAEAGAEDALLRVGKSLSWTSPIVTVVGAGSVSTSISVPIGGVRIIDADGDRSNRLRNVTVLYRNTTTGASFHYGTQIGDGGLEMRNGSSIVGNVFSNGTVFGTAGGSKTITGSITVARNGNQIDGLTIGVDAHAHSCKNSTIAGTLTYVTGGTIDNCTAGTTIDGGLDEIDPISFPISQALIDQWKADATGGGVIIGDVTVSVDTTLGPTEITGNLYVAGGVTLTMMGTIWARGTFDTGINATVQLDEMTYGSASGVMIISEKIQVRNNVVLSGASSSTSYLMLLGEDSSVLESSPAMEVGNNVAGAILFTPNGLMIIQNNVELIEATAYQLLLKNNATVTYEIGLENLDFSSGPGGEREVTSWQEL